MIFFKIAKTSAWIHQAMAPLERFQILRQVFGHDLFKALKI
jgi:hypothetical protein